MAAKDSMLFYKCRWCGKVFDLRGKVSPRGAVVGAIQKSMDPKCPPIMRMHECGEDRVGVADLVGAREVKDYENPAS